MREPPAVASIQEGVFTTADAGAVGWTGSALRHAVSTGDLIRLRAGVYALPPAAGPGQALARLTQAAVAAAVANHDVRVSHLAAARLSGWGVWAPRPRACVTHDHAATSDIDRVHAHRSHLWTPDRAHRAAIRMTSPARTVVDIAREFGPQAGLVVVDAGLASGMLDRSGLLSAIGRASGLPGIDSARILPDLMDGASESPLESRSRWAMHRQHIPAPARQEEIYTVTGQFLGRVDFYWDEFGVVGEADGRGKYGTKADVFNEKRREDDLRRTGLEVVRWGWDDLSRFSGRAAELRAAFAAGQARTSGRRWRTRQSRNVV